jgi:peptidoglycan hydrolase CwlO-like protein
VPTERRSRAALIRGFLAVALGAIVLSPIPSSAESTRSDRPAGADQEDPQEQRERVREQQAQINLEVDALQASVTDINRTLARLQRNVATQQAEAAEAERAWRAAEEDVAEAQRSVAAAEQRITDLDRATDAMVVDSFVNPPTGEILDAFNADTVSDAAVQQALLAMQADADADLMDQLNAAHEDLAIERSNKEEAAAEAEDRRNDSRAELADIQAAAQQQQEFANAVGERLDRRLAEAESLRRTDAALSRQIQEQQEELARQAAAAEAAAAAAGAAPPESSGSSTIEPAPGGLATVSCPTGGSTTVAGSIGENVQGLYNAAGDQGVPLCGSGYRDPEQQIQLRREHCGTSQYAIYEMPSYQCSPPTARPGNSMHEQGLAIDFTCSGGSIVAGGSCDNFLKSTADDYGLYNLPSEIWHYSTNGN